MSRRSVQDPSYQAEYEAFCQNREQAQLPYVSYRNFLRQWRRSARAHGEDVPSDRGHSKRELLDTGKGKVGKVRVELLPHHLLHPQERGKREMKMEELLPLPLKQRVETLPRLVYQSLLARPDMKLLGHRYKRWDIRVFHTKTLGVPVAFRI